MAGVLPIPMIARIELACMDRSVTYMRRLIKEIETTQVGMERGTPGWCLVMGNILDTTVKRASLEILSWLVLESGIDVNLIAAQTVAEEPNQRIISFLISQSWDINRPEINDQERRGKRLVHYLVEQDDVELVKWLVEEKGAILGGPSVQPTPKNLPAPPPIIELCTEFASVELFQEIWLRPGVILTSRLLHVAVRSAARMGVDPSAKTHETKARLKRAEMLRHLVLELGMNVNELDTTDEDVEDHWGTPINYAVKWRNSSRVVQWLLDQGADPTICAGNSGLDALHLVQSMYGAGPKSAPDRVLADWWQQQVE